MAMVTAAEMEMLHRRLLVALDRCAESRAIVRYLSEKYAGQGTPLLGKTVKDKALVSQWVEVESQNYNPPTSAIVFEKVFGPMFGKPCDEGVGAAQTTKLEKVLDVYESHLATSKLLAGDFFSLADLAGSEVAGGFSLRIIAEA
jgi:glutathione S-transferase